MDLLNLDDIEKPSRFISIKGVEYALAEQTVGFMIESIRVAKESEKETADELAIFGSMVRTCRSILPSCPEEVIHGLTFPQMSALIEFAAASKEELIEKSDAEVSGEDEGKPA